MDVNTDPIPNFVIQSPNVLHLPDSSILIGTEPLPEECFDKFLPNDTAKKQIKDPAQAALLTSESTLRSLAVLTHQNVTRGIARSTSYSHGRTVDLGFDYVPYGAVAGSTMLEKGGGFSGAMIADEDIALQYQGHRAIRTPGIQTFSDAQDNMNVTNRIIKHDGRWALTLGIITLKTEPTFRHLRRLYQGTRYIRLIDGNQQVIEAEKQTLALSFIIGGAEFRLENIIARSPEESREAVINYVAQGANNFLYELHQRLPQSSRALTYCPHPQRAFDALDLLSRDEALSREHTKAYFDFITGIFALDNAAYARAAHDSTYQWDLLGGELGQPRDADASLVQWDGDTGYDTTTDYPNFSPAQSTMLYMYNRIDTMQTLITLLTQCRLITTSNAYADVLAVKEAILRRTREFNQRDGITIPPSVYYQ